MAPELCLIWTSSWLRKLEVKKSVLVGFFSSGAESEQYYSTSFFLYLLSEGIIKWMLAAKEVPHKLVSWNGVPAVSVRALSHCFARRTTESKYLHKGCCGSWQQLLNGENSSETEPISYMSCVVVGLKIVGV